MRASSRHLPSPPPRAAVAALAALAAAALVGLASASSARAPGERAAEKRAAAASARAQESALGAEILRQSDAIAAVSVRVDAEGAAVAGLERALAGARARLGRLDGELRVQRRRLVFLRGQLGVERGRIAERLVELYTGHESSAVEVVLGAGDLGETLDRIDLYSRVAEQDSRLVAAVEGARSAEALARLRTLRLRREQAATTALVAHRTAERRRTLAVLASERDRLVALRTERQSALASIQVRRAEWEREAAALEAESARIARVLAARAAAARAAAAERAAAAVAAAVAPPAPATTGEGAPGAQEPPAAPAPPAQEPPPAPAPVAPVASGGLVWPVRGSVVSPFGERWGRLHAGLDIAAPAGTPIGAAAAGTVVYAGSESGYGLIVVLAHPDGTATAYAHNSSIAVSAGQQVAQGQTIASVGCTGRCFGNHVHFELRVGGNPVDPMSRL